MEGILLDALYHEPNEVTLKAMKEVESKALDNEPDMDLSSFEAMDLILE